MRRRNGLRAIVAAASLVLAVPALAAEGWFDCGSGFKVDMDSIRDYVYTTFDYEWDPGDDMSMFASAAVHCTNRIWYDSVDLHPIAEAEQTRFDDLSAFKQVAMAKVCRRVGRWP